MVEVELPPEVLQEEDTARKANNTVAHQVGMVAQAVMADPAAPVDLVDTEEVLQTLTVVAGVLRLEAGRPQQDRHLSRRLSRSIEKLKMNHANGCRQALTTNQTLPVL